MFYNHYLKFRTKCFFNKKKKKKKYLFIKININYLRYMYSLK